MKHTYGIATNNGEYIDVSNTERGAKCYATRHGYTEVYVRFNNGYHVAIRATKTNNKWITGSNV